MATRSVIAEPLDSPDRPDRWRGRYCHFDGYPGGVGSALFAAVTGHFAGDVAAARRYYLHDHNGWSHLGGNFAVPPGYGGPANTLRNQCYCHGDRREANDWITWDDPDPWGTEYAYVLADAGLVVLERADFDPRPRWGHGRGRPAWPSPWRALLDGPIPWAASPAALPWRRPPTPVPPAAPPRATRGARR